MNCKNCKTQLPDHLNYCHVCGAKVIRNRLTLKNLIASFSEQFFNYDNKFLQTFLMLIKNPGEVINSYINGTRKKYVNVISYFAIAITISGLQIYILQKYPVDFDAYYNPDPNIAKLQKQYNDSMFKTISEYNSLLMMLYIPLYALFAKLIFLRNKLLNYTELIVLFMYGQAQLSIAIGTLTAILIPLGGSMTIFGIFAVPIQILYFAYCLKSVYKLTAAQIILKTILFLFLLFILILLVTGIALAILFKIGAFDEMIEAQRAARESASILNLCIFNNLYLT